MQTCQTRAGTAIVHDSGVAVIVDLASKTGDSFKTRDTKIKKLIDSSACTLLQIISPL